jgi:hypothetical protein
MNCAQARAAMTDELAGRQDAEFREHVRSCEPCGAEFEAMERSWRLMDEWKDEEPHPHVRVRFHEMLDAYEQGARERGAKSSWSWWPSRPVWQFGIAAACLVAGFFGGRGLTVPGPQHSSDMAELRKEMSGMRQLVTLSLLQQQSASERLRGVTWAYQTEPSDMEVLGALLRTISTDSNVNVRLSAIDAIRNFAGSPVARRGLVQALPKQTSPLVQIALVDALVDLKQADAKPEIQTLLGTEDLDPTVRDRLKQAIGRLQ